MTHLKKRCLNFAVKNYSSSTTGSYLIENEYSIYCSILIVVKAKYKFESSQYVKENKKVT